MSGKAVKHQIAVNAGVIDSDYAGEIKVVLDNMGDQDYQIQKRDQIAQLMREKIVESDCYQVPKVGKAGEVNKHLEVRKPLKHRSARAAHELLESSTDCNNPIVEP